MVAPFASTQRIVCTAVRTSEAADEFGVSRNSRITYKPSTLLPWADPYIAGLVRKLQSEVRFERAAVCATTGHSASYADLEPPTPSIDSDWDSWDQPRWNSEGQPRE